MVDILDRPMPSVLQFAPGIFLVVGTPEGANVEALETTAGAGLIDAWGYHEPLSAAFIQRRIVREFAESAFEPDDLD